MPKFIKQFQYGGVEFEVVSDIAPIDLSDEHKLFWDPSCSSPVIAKVHCELIQTNKSVTNFGGRKIEWIPFEKHIEIRTCGLTSQIEETTDQNYKATIEVFDTKKNLSSFITAISGLILHQKGGTVFHASGIYLTSEKKDPTKGHGYAVLFIGPSGAGKTTTGNQIEEGYWFAKDRAAVYPTQNGWMVWGMASGDPLQIQKLPFQGIRLSAIFRVFQEHDKPFIKDIGTPLKLSYLRESAQMLTMKGFDEQKKLDILLELNQHVKVASIHPVIHQSIEQMIFTWLNKNVSI